MVQYSRPSSLTVTGKIQMFRMREVEIQKRGLEVVAQIQAA